MKRICTLALLVTLSLSLFGCDRTVVDPEPKNKIIYEYFDTVTVIYDYSGSSDDSFVKLCAELESQLRYYHELFDIYHTYEGVANIAYLNSMAGKGAVKVSDELIDFLEYAKEVYTLTDGYMNIAMGAVLSIWHEHRTEGLRDPKNATLPAMSALTEAAKHTDINKLVINRAAGTAELTDEKMSLDVGALAKGYATERLADYLYENDMMHYALDVGGNLRVVGDKPSGSGWQTGVRNPVGSGYAYKFTLKDSSAVTSGGYERYYTVDGKRYHHIIDKDTLMPAEHLASVTVIYPDSGLADALSTALFCMEYDGGADIIRSLDGARAVWVFNDGTVKTIGFDN